MLYCLGFPLNHWVYEVTVSILALVSKDLIFTIKYVICCRCSLSVKGYFILFLFFLNYENLCCCAKLLQSCPTQYSPIDSSPPGSSVPGILQARILECCQFLLQCRRVKSESEVAQSSLTLCNPMDCSLPGSSIHGVFQARVLEWVAISVSRRPSPGIELGSPTL